MRFYAGSEMDTRRESESRLGMRDSKGDKLKGCHERGLFIAHWKKNILPACMQKPIVCHVLYAIHTDLSYKAHCNPAPLKIVT